MKKTIVRIISGMSAFLLLMSAFSIGAAASPGNPEFLLAIGDSITTGYGLDGYDEMDPYLCESYTNLIANALGLTAKESYINKALSGATSADVLAYLSDIVNYVGYADLIFITVGVNDLLESISIIASAISGKSVTGLSASIDVLTAATPEKFNSLSTNDSFQKKMGAVLEKYEKNITDIAEIVKKNAPDARVIFLKQYNPLKNVPGFTDFGNFADVLISSVNSSIEKVCAANGFDIADVPSVIDVNAAALTNMLNYDVHPSTAGHLEIAKLIANHLGISLDPSENTKAPEPETEPVTETETTSADVTEINEETNAPEIETQPETSGCGSVVSLSATFLAAAFAYFVLKKKRA